MEQIRRLALGFEREIFGVNVEYRRKRCRQRCCKRTVKTAGFVPIALLGQVDFPASIVFFLQCVPKPEFSNASNSIWRDQREQRERTRVALKTFQRLCRRVSRRCGLKFFHARKACLLYIWPFDPPTNSSWFEHLLCFRGLFGLAAKVDQL